MAHINSYNGLIKVGPTDTWLSEYSVSKNTPDLTNCKKISFSTSDFQSNYTLATPDIRNGLPVAPLGTAVMKNSQGTITQPLSKTDLGLMLAIQNVYDSATKKYTPPPVGDLLKTATFYIELQDTSIADYGTTGNVNQHGNFYNSYSGVILQSLSLSWQLAQYATASYTLYGVRDGVVESTALASGDRTEDFLSMADISATTLATTAATPVSMGFDLTSLTLDINGNQNVGLQTGNSGFYSRRPVAGKQSWTGTITATVGSTDLLTLQGYYLASTPLDFQVGATGDPFIFNGRCQITALTTPINNDDIAFINITLTGVDLEWSVTIN